MILLVTFTVSYYINYLLILIIKLLMVKYVIIIRRVRTKVAMKDLMILYEKEVMWKRL